MLISNAVQRLQSSERVLTVRTGNSLRVNLASGDPDIATPDHICDALALALKTGYTHYAPKGGDHELRAALALHIHRQTGITYRPEDILITQGGTGAIFAAMSAVLNPHDQVLLPQPIYSLYADVAHLIGAEPVFVPVASDHHLDIDALYAAVTPRTRMLILNSPCNPTGVCFTRDELEMIFNLVEKLDLTVLSDEAYDHLVFDNQPHVSPLEIPGFAKRTIYVNTFSKTYAMTGWRIGYLAASSVIVEAARVIHSTAVGGVNAAVQRAALAALTGPMDWYPPMLAEYKVRRDLINEWLADVPGITWQRPAGSFYGFLRYNSDIAADDCTAWLRTHGIGVRSGTEFGPSGVSHVRISFAVARQTLLQGIALLSEAFAKLPASLG